MTLADYLRGNQRELPSAGTRGMETDWLTFCQLSITTGSLWAGDPCTVGPEEGCVLKVPQNMYTVEAKCVNFNGPKFISRLRVRLQEADEPVLGQEIGETGTDSAAIGVCDIKALDKVIGEDGERALEQIE